MGYQEGRVAGRDRLGVWDRHVHTAIFKIDKQQFSSVDQSCPTLCNPMNRSTPGRPPCPSPSPGVHSNSCPWSRWYHPAISSFNALFSFCPQSFPASDLSNESSVRIRWPKYWSSSFSISPSSEYSGLISLEIDCFDLPAVEVTFRSLIQCHSLKASILLPSLRSSSHNRTWPMGTP